MLDLTSSILLVNDCHNDPEEASHTEQWGTVCYKRMGALKDNALTLSQAVS